MPTLEELSRTRTPSTDASELPTSAFLLVAAEQVNSDKDLWKAQLHATDEKLQRRTFFVAPIIGSVLDKMVTWSKLKQAFFVRQGEKGIEAYTKR